MASSWSTRTWPKVAVTILIVIWATYLFRGPMTVSNLFTRPGGEDATEPAMDASFPVEEDPLYADIVDEEIDFDAAMPPTQHEPLTPSPSSKPPVKHGKVPAHQADQQAHATWTGYSVKPIAYIFPAYYPFKENNEIWGDGWTEWDNVRRVERNPLGLDTIRPAESIGYYNGLEYATRRRQAQYLKDSGFYGLVYHHYWFAGVPVMDHVLQAMLRDGEPDLPFMLSWANEPWRARWGGLDHDTLFIDQDYGHVADWRAHFDWCLPFFRHPRHIRSAGRVQFLVYKPAELAHVGPHMFAAWRQWARDAGFELDIIETRSAAAPPATAPAADARWNQGEPDAINDFQPHVAGNDQTRQPWAARPSRVYHRSLSVCWDATPRYFDDLSRSGPQPFCHPATWEAATVRMLGRVKADPNPVGAENFLFVNALNEWGEGNALEPSVQFGDGYARAMKRALATSERIHKWPDEVVKRGYAQATEEAKQGKETRPPAVCVLVRAHVLNDDDGLFPLSDLITSLQAQRNPDWVAVVYRRDLDEFPDLLQRVEQGLDSRVRFVDVPTTCLSAHGSEDAGAQALDCLLRNLTAVDEQCGRAKYVLITEAANTYASSAFDVLDGARADVLGLRMESRLRLADHSDLKSRKAHADRCERLEQANLNLCYAIDPRTATLDRIEIGSYFLSLPRLLAWMTDTSPSSSPPSSSSPFSALTSTHPRHQFGALISSLLTMQNWTLAMPSSSSVDHAAKDGDDSTPLPPCHGYANPTYTTCKRTGAIWLDGPVTKVSGSRAGAAAARDAGAVGGGGGAASGRGESHEDDDPVVRDAGTCHRPSELVAYDFDRLDLQYTRAHGVCTRFME